MSEPYIGQINIFGFNFAPRGWALCQGQLLSIAQNTALFSILGVNYGGDGRVTFGLPDLRGRAPVHVGSGQGPGLSPYQVGELGGTPTVTLQPSEMPQHPHVANCTDEVGNDYGPSGVWSADAGGAPQYAATRAGTLAPLATTLVGGSQPHNNMGPYLTVNYSIALQGIFPRR